MPSRHTRPSGIQEFENFILGRIGITLPYRRTDVTATQTKNRTNRTYLWFLGLLALLTVSAVTILIVFNVKQQLTRQKLDEAFALWKEKKPASYDMVFTKQVKEPEEFEVKVRAGAVVSVKMNGRPLDERQLIYYSMDALFDYVSQFLEIDSDPNAPRTYVVASFDKNDGHLIRYIRSVSANRQRVELHIKKLEVIEE